MIMSTNNINNDTIINVREIYDNRIDSLNGKHDTRKRRLLDRVKDEITHVYAKGRINEQHYNLLNKKIESFVNTNNYKTSDNILGNTDKTRVTKRSPL